MNTEGKYNTKESWHDVEGKRLHPRTNYYVGGNTKFYGAALFRLPGTIRRPTRRRAAASIPTRSASLRTEKPGWFSAKARR